MDSEHLVLKSERATATVLAEGGRLASLVVDGMELLVTEGSKATRYGSFPMVPWCGRLAYGDLRWQGNEWSFALNSPPHANHGLVFDTAWTVVDETKLQIDLPEAWPFGGHVVQSFVLDTDSLLVTLELHAGSQPMPGQVGWHPWFRRRLDRGAPVEVDFTAESIYEVDDDMIPTGAFGEVPTGPLNVTLAGTTAPPVLCWRDALTVQMESNLDHWVVFTEPDHAVAIEPQSGPPNAFNTTPQLVEPGKPLIGWMKLSW